ncbi:MAG: hypothetical protein HN742_18315 [Lentisphaerae bacterium]|nr:hypothetical protein [Lentisphaerota bacterium]MBT5606813.1 hypothetical protein [Lentisphaerota bacterium]MBT7061609.1 hypothetical protein [Lentisphaerota bacterium]MBT7843840.1 hypothetical protein [Lentisphaerota bacterium]
MKTDFSLLLVLLLCWCNASATEQSPDYVVLETRLLRLSSEPLEFYAWPDGQRPDFWVAPGRKDTSNGKGYVALWEIADSTLFLKAVDSYVPLPLEPAMIENGKHLGPRWQHLTLGQLFPGKVVRGRVLASWYSGVLVIPLGEPLEHEGPHGTLHEREVVLHVERGQVVKREMRVNSIPMGAPQAP